MFPWDSGVSVSAPDVVRAHPDRIVPPRLEALPEQDQSDRALVSWGAAMLLPTTAVETPNRGGPHTARVTKRGPEETLTWLFFSIWS